MALLQDTTDELKELGKAQAVPTTTANTYQADQREVANNETVEGRIAGIVDSGSPLMQRAETQAKQAVNNRGLLNSSIAVGASQNAVLDQAESIASQDAQLLGQQRLANQDASNQAEQFNTSSQNAFDQNAQQAELQQLLSEQGYNQDIGLRSLDQQLELGKLDATVYANMKGEYTNSMMDLVKNSAINISEIQKASDIPSAEKTKMIDQQISMRNSDIQFLQNLYEAMPTWNTGWALLN